MRKFIPTILILVALAAAAHQSLRWQVEEKSPDCKQIPFLEDGVQKVAMTCPAYLVFTTDPDTTKAPAPKKAK